MIGKRGLLRVPITLFIVAALFFVLIAFFSSSFMVKAITSLSSGVLVIAAGIYVYSSANSAAQRLKEKLGTMNVLLISESSEVINAAYSEMIRLYTGLPARQQKRFSEKVDAIQEIVENQLQAKKKVEELLAECPTLSFSSKKKKYAELYQHYQQLPSKIQREYYSQIVHLREGLERGR